VTKKIVGVFVPFFVRRFIGLFFFGSHNFGLIIGYGGCNYNVHLIQILMTCTFLAG
jgi:hypothetical protein